MRLDQIVYCLMVLIQESVVGNVFCPSTHLGRTGLVAMGPIDVESLPDVDSLPDDTGDVESLPDVGGVESLPGSEGVDSLPELMSDSEAELTSLVVPVPGDAPLAEQKDGLPGNCCAGNCVHVIETECAAELQQLLALKRKFSNDDFNEFIFKLLLVMRGVGRGAR